MRSYPLMNSGGRIVIILTRREIEIMDKIASIGRTNISMKQIADSLGLKYWYLMRKRSEMMKRNGYGTFLGFICDFVRFRDEIIVKNKTILKTKYPIQ